MDGVVAGIDVLLDEAIMTGSRLGIVSNQTGVDACGCPGWKRLLRAGYKVVALFGPEHGFHGEAQDAVPVPDARVGGLPVYSLFGEHTAPSEEMLRGIDAVLFDIQDAGCRYYTYMYTLAHTMRRCGDLGRTIVVLDRPNPIDATRVEGGPILKEQESFVGGFGLPHRHGMTVGEFGVYLSRRYMPGVDLKIVRMRHYQRSMDYRETGLAWIPPSPNLPSPRTALVYPGTCLFEGTNVSEGRGTTRPFETIGAPWIDGEELREALSSRGLPGVLFTSAFFTPTFSKFQGCPCGGVMLHVSNGEAFLPLLTGISILQTVKALYPDRLEWRRDWGNAKEYFIDKLAGDPRLRMMVDEGRDAREIYATACEGSPVFMSSRDDALLYL